MKKIMVCILMCFVISSLTACTVHSTENGKEIVQIILRTYDRRHCT